MPRATANLDAETRLSLEQELELAFQLSWNASGERRELVDRWRRVYHGQLKPKPHVWMSNLNIPLVKHMINDASNKLAATSLSNEPMFELFAHDPQHDDDALEEQNFMGHWIEEGRAKSKLNLAMRWAMIDGTSWVKVSVKATGKQPIEPYSNEPLDIDDLDVIPSFEYILIDDFMLLPFEAQTLAEAKGAFSRKWLRWTDIKAQEKAGAFYKDAVEYLESQWGTSPSQTPEQQYAGIQIQSPQTIWETRFECWQGIYRWKNPKDKVQQEKDWLLTIYVAVLQGDFHVTLCSAVEYEPNFGSQWFFTPIIANPQPNTLWGYSYVDDLEGLQRWMNTTFNSSTDALNVAIHPATVVGSSALSRKLVYGPGEQWPVNPTDVQVLHGDTGTFNGITASMNMVEYMRRFGERVMNMGDAQAGRQMQSKRTAAEVQNMIRNSNQIMEPIVSILQLGVEEGGGLKGVGEMLLQVIRKFMPEGRPIVYRSRKRSTANPSVTIDPEIHQHKYEVVPTGSSTTSSPEAKYSRAMATMQVAHECPFVKLSPLDNPEDVLDKMQSLYKAYEDYLTAIGHQHPEQIIGPKPVDEDDALRFAMTADPQVASAILQLMASRQGQPSLGAPQGQQPGQQQGQRPSAGGQGQQLGGAPDWSQSSAQPETAGGPM